MIPSYARPFLWSYEIDRLDLVRNKKRIITNILNLGSFEATRWLLKTYTRDDLKSAIVDPLPGEWNRKSFNYWCLIFDVKPNLIVRTLS